MTWHLAALAMILYRFGFAQILIKKYAADAGSRTRRLVWQFFFAALMATALSAMFNTPLYITTDTLAIAAIGAVNAFACYCHWRSYAISMAKTSMLMNLDDLTAMGLGLLILGETSVLTPMLTIGIIVSIVSASVFMYFGSVKRDPEQKTESIQLMFWVLGYSFIWGFASFAMRYFVTNGVSILSFVTPWYIGAWMGALVVRFFIMGKTEAGAPLTLGQTQHIFNLAFTIFTAMLLTVWVRSILPLTVSNPIELVAEMALPTVIAIWWFKEHRNEEINTKGKLTKGELYTILAGIIGTVIIAITF